MAASQATDVAQNRQRLAKMLQFQGYSACREALVLLEDHFTSSSQYESIEDFICKLNRTITFNIQASSSVIDPDLAHIAIQTLCNQGGRQAPQQQQHIANNGGDAETAPSQQPAGEIIIRVKNVEYEEQQQRQQQQQPTDNKLRAQSVAGGEKRANEFSIHYNFLCKRLNSLPVFRENFQLMKLETLTGSSQPNIRCICFGLLIKDISKIDGYLLIDSTGRVPLRLTADTTFRNRLAYTNCIVLVEGVYVNPDDILYAANIGLPPILLDPIPRKSLLTQAKQLNVDDNVENNDNNNDDEEDDDKLVVIVREIYMDDENVCKAVDMLFTGYNSMEEPPLLFILIGDFTQYSYRPSEYRAYTKKLIRIIRSCDNLKRSHFVFVPSQRDKCFMNAEGEFKDNLQMPKGPLTREQIQINLFHLSGFENVHLATNPTHVYLADRQITIVAHSYLKELKKNLMHDLSDHNEEVLEAAKQIILSNGHLAAGISKSYHSSMNLWHRPDLLVLADTEAFGNKYNYNSSSVTDTSFAVVPSFSRQYEQFTVYYLNTGIVEESQVSSDVIENLAESDDVQVIECHGEVGEEQRSELD